MASDELLKRLDTLAANIKGLQIRISELEEFNRKLQAENAELRREAEDARDMRDRAMLDAEYLMLSHRLAESPDSIAEARRHLATLIRNIDRCLEMLKE